MTGRMLRTFQRYDSQQQSEFLDELDRFRLATSRQAGRRSGLIESFGELDHDEQQQFLQELSKTIELLRLARRGDPRN